MQAYTLEQIRKLLLKKDMTLSKLFQTYDRNKDDILEAKEFEKALEDMGVKLPSNIYQFLLTEIFDPQAQKQRRSARITKKILRKYVEGNGVIGSKMVQQKEKSAPISMPNDSELVRKGGPGKQIS